MRTTWTFHSAAHSCSGRGATKDIGALAVRHGIRRMLVVTDTTLVRAGLCQPVEESLRAAGVRVQTFDGGLPEPSIEIALQCVASSRAFQPDGVLGLGGGSNLDLAKVTAILLAHGKTPLDYAGDDRIPGPVLPLFCLPTTAGTGSEVSAAAVLTDTANKMKFGILSNYLRPLVALVDPLLTLSCPPKVGADSGIDALTHAIEAYTAVDNELFPLPSGEPLGLPGRIPSATCLQKRRSRSSGASAACRARRPGYRSPKRWHSVPRSAAWRFPTSASRSSMLSNIQSAGRLIARTERATACCCRSSWLQQAARVSHMARIATLLGEDCAGLSQDAAAERAIVAIEKLRADIGIPLRLRDLGVKADQCAASPKSRSP